MPPIRRYLRISKFSVLECRIYLDNPSDTRWLLDTRDPVLPRIFAAIRPLVLPKLREENERLWARKRGHPVKDVIAEDEFEVALFLRESRTRHSLLTRQKTFEEPGSKQPQRDNQPASTEGGILVESDDDAGFDIHNIPAADTDTDTSSNSKRQAADQSDTSPEPSERAPKRQKKQLAQAQEEEDEKKLKFRTNYESFNIYGWVLCLLVTRRGDSARKEASEPKGQVLMEEWMSTQAQGDVDEE